MILSFSRPEFETRIKKNIKVHTIRRDANHRWKVGRKIHFWYGNPRNTRGRSKPHSFGTGVVSKILPIKIDPNSNYIVFNESKICEKSFLDFFAIHDGFDNWEEMKTFFPDVFVGKLIFWNECEFH